MLWVDFLGEFLKTQDMTLDLVGRHARSKSEIHLFAIFHQLILLVSRHFINTFSQSMHCLQIRLKLGPLQRERTQIRMLSVFGGAGSGILLPNRQRNAEIPDCCKRRSNNVPQRR